MAFQVCPAAVVPLCLSWAQRLCPALFLSLSLLSIILTGAWSFLLVCFSILWQETFLLLLYGLLLHYCTARVIELTFYSTPGFALQSNLSLQHQAFPGDNEVCLWPCWCHHISFVPHLVGHSLQENELWNTRERMDVLQLTWSQFALTWVDFCFRLTGDTPAPEPVFSILVSLMLIMYDQ